LGSDIFKTEVSMLFLPEFDRDLQDIVFSLLQHPVPPQRLGESI
jgi:hypothetical protein